MFFEFCAIPWRWCSQSTESRVRSLEGCRYSYFNGQAPHSSTGTWSRMQDLGMMGMEYRNARCVRDRLRTRSPKGDTSGAGESKADGRKKPVRCGQGLAGAPYKGRIFIEPILRTPVINSAPQIFAFY